MEVFFRNPIFYTFEHFEGFLLKSTPKNVHFGNNPKFRKRYTLRKKNTVWVPPSNLENPEDFQDNTIIDYGGCISAAGEKFWGF